MISLPSWIRFWPACNLPRTPDWLGIELCTWAFGGQMLPKGTSDVTNGRRVGNLLPTGASDVTNGRRVGNLLPAGASDVTNGRRVGNLLPTGICYPCDG